MAKGHEWDLPRVIVGTVKGRLYVRNKPQNDDFTARIALD